MTDMEAGSPDIISSLARIRQLQGLPPLSDPTQIDGPQTPWPALPPDLLDEDPDFEPVPDSEPISPLVPRPAISTGYVPNAQPPAIPAVDPSMLVIVDKAASYKGWATELSDAEREQIGRIVLKAVHRKLAAELPQRKRRGKPEVPSAERSGLPTAPAPRRKPGRPRKPRQHLDGSVT